MIELKKPYSDVKEAEKYFSSLYGESSDFQKKRYNDAFNGFKKLFNKDEAYICSSSGRVEIVGNHTDHNGGRVISCAISLDTLAFFLPTDDGIVHIHSEGHKEIIVDLNGEEKEEKSTPSSLVRGVAVAVKNKGYKIGGFNAYCTSTVLGGAGISSSASFEVLIAEIFNFLYNDGKITQEEKAIFSQFAENVYFGKPSGLLDQTAVSYGGLNKLDFSEKGKIGVFPIKNDLSDYTLILINTGGSHENLTDAYAEIPAEMFKVAKCFNKDRLIEISEEDFYKKLPSIANKLSDREIMRAIHFYNENARVDNATNALNGNMYEEFLEDIRKSGISSFTKLQNCFVAGSKEQPIPRALSIAEKYLHGGANRVHGGGFAGSILNIVSNYYADDFVKEMSKYFGEENVIPLHVRSVGTIVL